MRKALAAKVPSRGRAVRHSFLEIKGVHYAENIGIAIVPRNEILTLTDRFNATYLKFFAIVVSFVVF
jgi:hypothetical protein